MLKQYLLYLLYTLDSRDRDVIYLFFRPRHKYVLVNQFDEG